MGRYFYNVLRRLYNRIIMNIPQLLNIKYEPYVNKVEIKEILPIIVEDTYNVGFIERYFTKNILIKNSKILEIDFEIYNNILNNNLKYPFEYYMVVKVIWKIIGVLEDFNIKGDTVIHGVRDTNKRSVIEANQILNGIDIKLANFIEYARIQK